MISLPDIRAALAGHAPAVLCEPERSADRASVALVLAGCTGSLCLCFIRRASRIDDRWSGDMAFPGGRASAADSSAEAVARRETHEEVGIDLERADLLGPLSEVSIRKRGPDTIAVLSPFVFYVGPQPPRLIPNDEVVQAHWIGLGHLWDPQNLTRVEYGRTGATSGYPGIRYEGHVIWGLTYRVLAELAETIGAPLPSKP